MKDLVALQMTRRQPMPAYDMAKAKPANTASTANRQVTHTHTEKTMKTSLSSVWTCSQTNLFDPSRTTSESSSSSAEREGECEAVHFIMHTLRRVQMTFHSTHTHRYSDIP